MFALLSVQQHYKMLYQVALQYSKFWKCRRSEFAFCHLHSEFYFLHFQEGIFMVSVRSVPIVVNLGSKSRLLLLLNTLEMFWASAQAVVEVGSCNLPCQQPEKKNAV